MKNLVLVLLISTVGPVAAKDQDKVVRDLHYLCLNTIASGLNWSSGKWAQVTFPALGEFQLEIEIDERVFSDGSKHQFIHFTHDGDSGHYHCGAELALSCEPGWTCITVGQTTVFSEDESRGGISYLLGSESSATAGRDSLVVAPFTCQKR
jgi:hypothetical protein